MAEEIIKVLEYITNNEFCQDVILVLIAGWAFKWMVKVFFA